MACPDGLLLSDTFRADHAQHAVIATARLLHKLGSFQVLLLLPGLGLAVVVIVGLGVVVFVFRVGLVRGGRSFFHLGRLLALYLLLCNVLGLNFFVWRLFLIITFLIRPVHNKRI